MDEEVKPTEILIAGIETKPLTIKIANSSNQTSGSNRLINTPRTSTNQSLSNIVTSNSRSRNIATTDSAASSAYNSPLISPPSSAFVSALQSPYISPRANLPLSHANSTPETTTPTTTLTHPSPLDSYCGSQSDDIPSTSYTPPPERFDFSDDPSNKGYDFSDDPSNTKRFDFCDDPSNTNTKKFDFSDDPSNKNLKFVTCGQETVPRVSFSFPVPRISFAKGSVSPASNAKLRSCDVYIGYHGQNPNLVRFCKWLRSELEVQGIACFVADRAKYVDNQSHEIADRVICSVTFGVVVVTSYSLLNHLTLEEIRFFAQKKNLIPVFFDGDVNEIQSIFNRNSVSKELKEALDGLDKCNEYKLEAEEGNWRACVSKASSILTSKLGRKSVAEKEIEGLEELPFSRNKYFVGREKEIAEIETAFFGNGDYFEQEYNVKVSPSEGLVVLDENFDTGRGKYLNLEVGKGKEQKLEAWVEPTNGRNIIKRPKIKKSKSGKYKSFGSSVVCITGLPGIGKTELVLEFACRYSQRYKMVLWVGGEAQYFRQNLLNLSSKLGLDVSADTEKERGRIRSFDEQENEAFKRVKRELFRDMPYLLIIDNLETEKEWWEGKDLHDLIPRNTGGTHVIITSRLSKVMNFDPVQLQPLSVSDAIMLMRGRRKKEYPSIEMEFLEKFDEKLGRSSFGLRLIGSLLSELPISPSALFEAINQLPIEEVADFSNASVADQQLFRSFPFLIKVLEFCAAVLHQTSGSRNLLAMKMFQVGAWFAPSPVSANLLAAAAKHMPAPRNRLGNWTKYVKQTLFCGSGCLTNQAWKTEEDSALLLVKLGLARKTTGQPGCWIQFHHITQVFGKGKDGLVASKSMVKAVRKIGNPRLHRDHLWASAFLVFGFKAEPPLVQLKAMDMVLFTKKTALPLAIEAFTTFSRCNSSLELLKVCTNVLEEVEKSFVTQIQDWCHGSFCWKKALHSHQKVDEYVWQEVTLLKAALLEARAKLLLRGGHFDSGEDLCRTCISIRTVMLGHNHAQTLAAQETLAKLVRMRSKIQQ